MARGAKTLAERPTPLDSSANRYHKGMIPKRSRRAMAEDLMRYEDLAREALRGVVREALRRAAEQGLPGAHHFYIAFRTQAPGVDLDEDLLATHPEEMTIVLEHQYWDLAVDEDAFEVTLKFKGVPKYLRVPFAAVTQFHDPHVGFTLRFEPPPSDGAARRSPAPAPAEEAPAPDQPEAAAGGQVVSLDAFRKRTD
jgi:hypothetical protein